LLAVSLLLTVQAAEAETQLSTARWSSCQLWQRRQQSQQQQQQQQQQTHCCHIAD
jgi:hypothetical protein